MEPKDVVRQIVFPIEERKKVLNLVYSCGEDRGKRIEWWINTELLANLLELQEKGKIESATGEKKYPIKKTNRFEHCDLWWKANNKEQWLEVKTIRIHDDYVGIKPNYLRHIKDDFDKINRLREQMDFYHLLLLFNDKKYSIGNWENDINKIYKELDANLEVKWEFPVLPPEKTVHAFLHHSISRPSPLIYRN